MQAPCQIDFAQTAVKYRKNTFNYAINFGEGKFEADFLGDSVQKSNAGKFKMNAIIMHSISLPEALCWRIFPANTIYPGSRDIFRDRA
ncbi:hypothetical protein ADU59_16065 [Pararhizobium polonicum]|uniref:Uncharacterized protein n=1 Tax=Pararhizobium polonicum TaxID=1612624 RepID=A0A1C7P056_9HYPH|nr:hypothetical protein ADU59_16065 [Pararhizobium polonicum]